MNRLLADALAALNILFAILVVALVAKLGEQFVGGLGGIVLGDGIGAAIAGLYCGVIAFLALIEGHLRVLAEGEGSIRRKFQDAGGRIEPRL